MSKIFFVFSVFYFLFVPRLFSQNGVNISTLNQVSSDSSAILDVNSSDKGLLIPRMSAVERSMIQGAAEGLMVFQQDGVQGFYFYNGSKWEKIEDETETAPIGMVVEWWRPSAVFPLPEGFAICDGSMVTDPESPFNGTNLPNLLNAFVKGVVDTNLIGSTGNGVHSHSFDPPNRTLSEAGEHTHPFSFNVSLSIAAGHSHIHPGLDFLLSSSHTHNHKWSEFETEINFPQGPKYNWKNGLGGLLMQWTDGMDGFGADYFTLGVDSDVFSSGTTSFYTDNNIHNHIVNLGTSLNNSQHTHTPVFIAPTVSTEGSHTHTLDLPATESNTANDISPPFFGLLKIIKIK